MNVIKVSPTYAQILGITLPPAGIVVNGYEIAKTECGVWGVIKIGYTRGVSFKTKKAAVKFAAECLKCS